jgi:ABC-type multidrug transport system permease subunit
MRGVPKIFNREIQSLFYRPYLAIWLVVIPLCFLYVAGSSSTSPPKVKTLIQPAEDASPSFEVVNRLISEYSQIELAEWVDGMSPTPASIDSAKAHIGIFWNQYLEDKEGNWQIVVRPYDTEDRMLLLELAKRISFALTFKEPMEFKLIKDNKYYPKSNIQILDFGVLPSQNDTFMVPRMISLIATFLPFLLAVGMLTRDKSNDSLSYLLTAPGVNWWSLILGKTLTCLFLAIVNWLILIIASVAIFNMSVRSGLLSSLSIQFLAMLVSTLLGMGASAMVRSQFQGYLLAALYAFCLIFLTGLIFPLEQAAPPVRFASYFFPLTFSFDVLQQATILGVPRWHFGVETMWLIGQCLATTVLATICLTFARNRL